MVARKGKKAVKTIKFQVTKSGIAGIGVVCFCVFLWMFLLGVWAGQSLLFPPVAADQLAPVLHDSGEGKEVFDVIRIEAEKKKVKS
jgi:hypothetical protein